MPARPQQRRKNDTTSVKWGENNAPGKKKNGAVTKDQKCFHRIRKEKTACKVLMEKGGLLTTAPINSS